MRSQAGGNHILRSVFHPRAASAARSGHARRRAHRHCANQGLTSYSGHNCITFSNFRQALGIISREVGAIEAAKFRIARPAFARFVAPFAPVCPRSSSGRREHCASRPCRKPGGQRHKPAGSVRSPRFCGPAFTRMAVCPSARFSGARHDIPPRRALLFKVGRFCLSVALRPLRQTHRPPARGEKRHRRTRISAAHRGGPTPSRARGRSRPLPSLHRLRP